MASFTSLESIAKQIKKAVRIIFFEEFHSPSIPLFKKLNILPLVCSIKLRYSKFMWKLFNGLLPNSLSSYFYKNTRTQYSITESRLASLEKFVLFAGPKVWKDIPIDIKNKPSLSSFSKCLSKFYIANL